MKTHLLLLSLICFALAGSGCKPGQDKHNTGTDISQSGDSAAPAIDQAPRYWRLVGTVGKYAVLMDLAYRPSVDEEYAYYGYHGSYYYESKEDLIDLYGSLDSTGNLVLTEVTISGDVSPSFKGVFDKAGGRYSGTWTSADGKRQLPFELKEDFTGAVRFESQKFEETSKLFPGQSGSPDASISMVWLIPASGTDPEVAAFLRNAILRGMAGDSLASLYSTPEQVFGVVSQSYFRSYREDIGDVGADEIDPEANIMFTYENDSSVEVLYNRNGLLTLGYYNYYFTGGAHGNYGTYLTAYDLGSRKKITLEDVFVSGYENRIAPYLERAVRRRFGLGSQDSLDSVLFEATVAPTENFGLTGKGVIFNYPPYDIAAYAAGEIRLFVPYTEIKGLLQPAFAARVQIK